MKMKPAIVKALLISKIMECAKLKDQFVNRPGKDFSRKRALTFESVLTLLLKFSGMALQNEISSYFVPLPGKKVPVPTKSAFIQQRNKLLPEAGYMLFRSFSLSLTNMLTFRGYRLMAADGSNVSIPRNDKETDYSCNTGMGRKSFNMLHINCLFDVLNRVFVDCIIDPGLHAGERAALAIMTARLSDPENTIIVADRGYEGFNCIAHLLKCGVKFAVRAKDIDSNGFLTTLHLLEDGTFDIVIKKKLVLAIPKGQKENPEYVKVKRENFDYLDSSSDYYEMEFRVVRVQLPNGTYECIVTNLSREEFSAEDLREMYCLRWAIENAYRDLKYTVDMLHFHGKSAQAVTLEVYASLTFFNYCAYIAVHCDPLSHKESTKYQYKVNFANAVSSCREFLHDRISETDLLDRLKLNPTPIRDNRSYPRPSRMKEQSSREFNYRAS